MLEPYLPRGRGQVLITSRSPAWRGTASTTVEMPLLDRPESIAMLRTWTSEIKEAAADLVAEAVGDLPQAIDQAGSLLTVGGLTVGEYLHLLDECAVEIHGHDARGTTPPAAASWILSFDHLAKDDPVAMDLLSLIAWCGPAPVPRSVLVPRPDRSDLVDDSAFPDRSARPDRSVPLPATLRAVANNPLALADKIGVLHLRGLVVATNPVVLHRVPASLLKARRGVDEPIPWAAVVVRLLRAALPDDVWDNPSRWDIWRRLLPHVRAATAAGRDTHTAREHVAWLLDRMATYLHTTGDPRAALPVFRRALRIARSHLGGDHPATLFYANNLAHDLHDLGHHREAFALNQDTFARRRRDLGDNHQDTLKSAKNLARNLFDLGEFDKARARDDDVLARRRRVLGIDHEDTLNSARNLANDLRALGEHDQARALHEETLHRLHRTLGEEHPRSLQCARDLADDLCAAGEYGEPATCTRRRSIAVGGSSATTILTP